MVLLRLYLSIGIILGGIEIKGQEPEKCFLWPEGAEESNGLEGKERLEEEGRIVCNSVAEIYLYRPQLENITDKVVIICPGGGYYCLAMYHEGELFARWLNEQGITALVLKYRMPGGHDQIPLADAQRAVQWVRNKAEAWNINALKVGIAGFSAGGHLASTLATHFKDAKKDASDDLDKYSSRPDFVLLFYPVISMQDGLTHWGSRNALLGSRPKADKVNNYSNELQVTAETPPVFIIHSDDDKTVSSLNSVLFYHALKQKDVAAVLYILPKGGHGWGVRDSFEYYPLWTALLEKWLKAV